ncbi:MAG: PilW family protein [Gemmatimonadales bacterium]
MTKRGFTLIELLIAALVAGILVTVLTRILLSDSRFVSRQDAMMSARQTARAALNVTAVELRMVSSGGLIAAAPDSILVRVPYAFGMSCGTSAGLTVGSMMPTDSMMYANATPAGMARLQPDNTYSFLPAITAASSTDVAACTAQNVNIIPSGFLVGITPPNAATAGTIFYLYDNVAYRFMPSADLPGRIGLWRRSGTASYSELVAPFDSTARFRFLVGPSLQVNDNPPADLTTVNGLELKFVSASSSPPQGESAYQNFDLPVQVVFFNKSN